MRKDLYQSHIKQKSCIPRWEWRWTESIHTGIAGTAAPPDFATSAAQNIARWEQSWRSRRTRKLRRLPAGCRLLPTTHNAFVITDSPCRLAHFVERLLDSCEVVSSSSDMTGFLPQPRIYHRPCWLASPLFIASYHTNRLNNRQAIWWVEFITSRAGYQADWGMYHKEIRSIYAEVPSAQDAPRITENMYRLWTSSNTVFSLCIAIPTRNHNWKRLGKVFAVKTCRESLLFLQTAL